MTSMNFTKNPFVHNSQASNRYTNVSIDIEDIHEGTRTKETRQSRYDSMLSNYDKQLSLMQFKRLPKQELESKRLSIDNIQRVSPSPRDKQESM